MSELNIPVLSLHIVLTRTADFQQHVSLLFGAQCLAEINASRESFILPRVDYEPSFIMTIFILQ